MPEALTTRLGAYPTFKIIERGQLDQVLNELNLGQSGIVDAESARQVGKILGQVPCCLEVFRGSSIMSRFW